MFIKEITGSHHPRYRDKNLEARAEALGAHKFNKSRGAAVNLSGAEKS